MSGVHSPYVPPFLVVALPQIHVQNMLVAYLLVSFLSYQQKSLLVTFPIHKHVVSVPHAMFISKLTLKVLLK